MKVSRTAAVLVGCALAATADVVSGSGHGNNHPQGRPGKAASDVEAASVSNNHGNHRNDEHRDAKKKKRAGHRALRGNAEATEGGKTAKTHGDARTQKKNGNKKRSLKSQKGGGGGGAGGGGNGANRAYTAYNNNGNQQAVDNTPYVNNKHDYLDRYSAYLTPEQLQRLRTNPNPPADQETNVGGTEEAVVSAPAGSVGRPAAGSSYSQTAAVQQGPAATPYVSTLSREGEKDSNDRDDNPRGFEATSGANVDALNRGFEAEAPFPNYNPATGYGSTGNGGNAVNANGGGALDIDAPVQTTEWKPIDIQVWLEHYNVPLKGQPTDPAKPNNGNGVNIGNGNGINIGGGSANFNTANAVNRISASEAPCDGANPSAAPSQGIQHVFDNTLWGTCSTTEGGCQPGSCCLFHPTFNRGACVPFEEICEPGETAGEGDCPYPWMTSDKCRCAGSGGGPLSSF